MVGGAAAGEGAEGKKDGAVAALFTVAPVAGAPEVTIDCAGVTVQVAASGVPRQAMVTAPLKLLVGYGADDDCGGGFLGDGTPPCIARRRELVCPSLKRRELCPNLAVQYSDSLEKISLWRDI
jgi:hypothetical protein